MKRLLIVCGIAALLFVPAALSLSTLTVNPSQPVAGGTVSFSGGKPAPKNSSAYVNLYCWDAAGGQLATQTQQYDGNLFTLDATAVSCQATEYTLGKSSAGSLLGNSPIFAVS